MVERTPAFRLRRAADIAMARVAPSSYVTVGTTRLIGFDLASLATGDATPHVSGTSKMGRFGFLPRLNCRGFFARQTRLAQVAGAFGGGFSFGYSVQDSQSSHGRPPPARRRCWSAARELE
jgi:hypothetical protein